VLSSLVAHVPKEETLDEQKELMETLQGQAVMAVLTEEQKGEFRGKQGVIETLARNPSPQSQSQAQSAMEELTTWVQTIMTSDQREGIGRAMMELLEQHQLDRTQQEIQAATSAITQAVLTGEQQQDMTNGQQRAAHLHNQGKTAEAMRVVQEVQKSLEASLTKRQRLQVKETLEVRLRGIYAAWMDSTLEADAASSNQTELMKRITPADKASLEKLQASLAQSSNERERRVRMEELISFQDSMLSISAKKEFESFLVTNAQAFATQRLKEFKGHIMIVIQQSAIADAMNPSQQQQALGLQTAVQMARAKEDLDSFEKASKGLEDFMAGCLDEEQQASAVASVAKSEASLDQHIAAWKGQAAADSLGSREGMQGTQAGVAKGSQIHVAGEVID